MKEQDIKHIEAINDFFGKSICSEYSTVRNERGDYHVMNISPFDNKIIRCHFKKFAYPVTVAETIYKNNCSFHLTNMSDVDVSYIFRDNDYNYDIVEKVINALFKLGQEFSFYTEMSPIQNIKLENNFNKNGIQKAVIVPTVTKLTLSSILADKSASGRPTKKPAIVHLAFMVSNDNQLHRF